MFWSFFPFSFENVSSDRPERRVGSRPELMGYYRIVLDCSYMILLYPDLEYFSLST